MSSKKPAPTNEDLEAMFAGIGDADTETSSPSTTNTSKRPTPTSTEPDDDDILAELANLTAKTSKVFKKPTPTPISTEPDNDELLAELANLTTAARKARSLNQPQTPRSLPGGRGRPEPIINTPTSTVASGRTSEDKDSESGQKTISVPSAPPNASQTRPQRSDPQPEAEPGQSGGWGGWGGWASSLATAAVKQAQSTVKEIQKNEEAQKWAEQVKGYGGGLSNIRGLADLSNLRDKALPTFTSLLHTLAPPISQHERLQIHITHDLLGYPSMDPLIYQTFSRVMSQVEGGDLLVIHRGAEPNNHRRISEVAYGGGLGGNSTWSDGPWWRAGNERSLNAVTGLDEGRKLCKVSATSYSSEFYTARGGLEEAAKQATVGLSEEKTVRTSDIFLAVQAVVHGDAGEQIESGEEKQEAEEEEEDELVSFAVYLHDPIHSIAFSTISQSFPQKWSAWLNAPNAEDGLPEEIAEIIEGGGVDPREWVSEWMEEILTTAVGVVAQRYVAKRMGVGENAMGRGKRREEAVESNGGEAARAGII